MTWGRVAGASILVAVLVSACGSNPGLIPRGRVAPVEIAISRLAWDGCGRGFECATMRVPLDYSHPARRKISLSLIRRPSTGGPQKIGSVLLNPGGPGESGIDFLRAAAGDFSFLNSYFDLVSWDPRGVGRSTPVTCMDGPQLDQYLALDSVLDDAQEKQAYIQGIKDFTAACEGKSGDLLPYMDTASTAMDMDMIRRALGDSRLTYLGFSYGTFLGQWYAHLYPKHIRATALDGVVDSTESGDQFLISQVAGFQQNLDAFFAACKARPGCTYGRTGDPAAKLEASIDAVDKTPMRVGARALTRSMALRGVLVTLYSEASWPYLDQALTNLDRGDGRLLLALADFFDGRRPDGTYANLLNGANQATGCIDSFAPTDLALYERLGPALTKASELFGPWTQYGGLACAYWPVKGKHIFDRLTVIGAPPVLLVGATHDPATPYADAQSVTKQIPGSVLLTREGNGHTSYAASRCVQAAEDAYLIYLRLPAPGTVCSS